MTRRRAFAAVALALALLAGAVAALPGARALLQGAEDRHEQGRRIYNFRCYYCHGYSGDAKTLAASFVDPPPRDFTAASSSGLGAEQIAAAVREGRPGTAMASFRKVIDADEIEAVAAFVAREFVRERKPNTRYHTADNGWPGHERHAAAFPFARGEIAIDTDDDTLSAEQRAGKRLFMATCISCHDRARVEDSGPAWAARPVSYPRAGFVYDPAAPPPVDAVSSASVYARHDVAPRAAGLSARERRGQALFQANCAFCHGADGSGRNWIGQFMQPKARDLGSLDPTTMPAALLRERIRDGLPGTSMPAWHAVLAPREIDAVAAYVERALFRGGTHAQR